MRVLLLWILNALALLAVTWLLPSIQLSGFGSALLAALGLGFINTLVRPVLALLTLPITVLTLGIFYLVLNGFLFWFASVAGLSRRGLRHGVAGRAALWRDCVGAVRARPQFQRLMHDRPYLQF